MKSINKYYKNFRISQLLIAGLLVVGLGSCDNLLDTVPQTSISAENAFDTPARILGQVNGIYKSLKKADLYGGRYLLFQDVRGEEFINVTANSYTAYNSWNNSYASGSSDVVNLWSAAYTTINNANILIDGLANVNGVIPDSVKTQYVAEAKFLRALSYFSLVTVFARPYNQDGGASAGLPLRLQAETSLANNDLARSSVAKVYDQIISDLNDAEAGLPKSYSTSLLNTTRAHKNAAIALKTRVYLNKGDYSSVVAEAQKIVPQIVAPFAATTGVKHKLQDIVTIFSSDYTTTESILSMPMSTNDSYTGQSSIAYIYNDNSEYYLNPTGIFGEAQWGSTDSRRQFLRLVSGKYYFKKYAKPSPYLDYIPVIRYAEVLLNYAEAAAQTGNLTLATSLLKAVHARSDQSFTFANSALDTQAALLNTILKERRIELLGEGFRSNDLLRYLQPIPAKGSSSLQAPAVQPTDENYIFPLPSTEVSTNKLL